MKNHFGLIIFVAIIAILVVVALLPTDEDKYLKEITVKEVKEKIDKKESFILYTKQTDCEHCKAFTPRFASALKEFKQEAFVVNLTNLSDEDKQEYEKLTGVEGTPTVLFYKDGAKSLITIDGEQPKERIKSKLKSAGFKEKK